MRNFLRFGIPGVALIIIIVAGYFLLFSQPATTTPTTASVIGNSQGCNIKYQPTVKQYNKYPSMCIDTSKAYSALIHTNMGDISMNLLAANAPKTVNSFVFLTKSGYFDNLTFHRVIPQFVIQGGDPKGDGSGNPGYSFADEINPANLGLTSDAIQTNKSDGYNYSSTLQTIKITTGVVAMANSGPNTNGSQFFITLADQPTLDGKYTPFGIVTSGMDIANKIAAVNVDGSNKPLIPVKIEKVTITEN